MFRFDNVQQSHPLSKGVNRMRNSMRMGVLLVFALLLSVAAAMPVAAETVIGVTDTEILLGTSVPLSGPAADWGYTARGMEAYIQHINEQGGIHGRTIRFVALDDGYDPSRTVQNVRQLVENHGVFGLVGTIGSANAAATRDYIFDSGVIWMTPAVEQGPWQNNPRIGKLFVTYPNYYEEAKILARYAAQELGHGRVAVIYQNDQYGGEGNLGVTDALNEIGLRPVETIPYELSETDFSVHALRIARARADAVIIYAAPQHALMLAIELAALPIPPQILVTFTLADPRMAILGGPAWEGVIVPSYFPYPGTDPDVDRVLEIISGYNPELLQASFISLAGITFLEPMLEGLRRAGPDLTHESFVAAMESIQNWDGDLLRDVSFGPDRRQGINKIFLSRMVDGQPQQITDWIEYPVEF